MTPLALYKEGQDRLFFTISYLQSTYLKNGPDKATQSDAIRIEKIIVELSLIQEAFRFMSISKNNLLVAAIITESVEKIENLLNEPMLNFFPDIHLWMMHKTFPIGICNIKAADILWSSNKHEKGLICNKFIYADISVSSYLKKKYSGLT